MSPPKLNAKQEAFCQEYIVDFNATQAAIRAGYSEKTANRIGSQLLSKLDIKQRVAELREAYLDEQIISAKEVEVLLSQIATGNMDEEVIVVEGVGEGCSQARSLRKQVDSKSRLKALELLAKRYGILSADVKVDIKPVMFVGDNDIPD